MHNLGIFGAKQGIFSNFKFDPILVKLKKNQNRVGPTVSRPVRTTGQLHPDRANLP
jgi:hypothetical protein